VGVAVLFFGLSAASRSSCRVSGEIRRGRELSVIRPDRSITSREPFPLIGAVPGVERWMRSSSFCVLEEVAPSDAERGGSVVEDLASTNGSTDEELNVDLSGTLLGVEGVEEFESVGVCAVLFFVFEPGGRPGPRFTTGGGAEVSLHRHMRSPFFFQMKARHLGQKLMGFIKQIRSTFSSRIAR